MHQLHRRRHRRQTLWVAVLTVTLMIGGAVTTAAVVRSAANWQAPNWQASTRAAPISVPPIMRLDR